MAEPRLYRVKVVNRRTGASHNVAVLADGDVEACDALQDGYPHQRYRWFDREDDEREITLFDREERRVG